MQAPNRPKLEMECIPTTAWFNHSSPAFVSRQGKFLAILCDLKKLVADLNDPHHFFLLIR